MSDDKEVHALRAELKALKEEHAAEKASVAGALNAVAEAVKAMAASSGKANDIAVNPGEQIESLRRATINRPTKPVVWAAAIVPIGASDGSLICMFEFQSPVGAGPEVEPTYIGTKLPWQWDERAYFPVRADSVKVAAVASNILSRFTQPQRSSFAGAYPGGFQALLDADDSIVGNLHWAQAGRDGRLAMYKELVMLANFAHGKPLSHIRARCSRFDLIEDPSQPPPAWWAELAAIPGAAP